jgi:hypothetical protein
MLDAVPDERIRAPQEPPGVITKAVAERIAEALRENCISIAARTLADSVAVEGDGVMASTPEVAAKLQEMYPAPAPGFQYDLSSELETTFEPDASLGPASYQERSIASTQKKRLD